MIDTFLERVGEKKVEGTGEELLFFAMGLAAKLDLEDKFSGSGHKQAISFFLSVLDAFVNIDKETRSEVIEASKTAWKLSDALTKKNNPKEIVEALQKVLERVQH